MADPEISQTNFIPLHQPKSSTASSSYDPEISACISSYEDSSGDDEDPSLSRLEEACSTLQLNTSSDSSTESLDGLVDSPRHHHNQSLAEPTDAGTNSTTTPTAEMVCGICDKEAAKSCDAGLCTDCCKSNNAESIDCCDDHWIDNAGSDPDSDSDDDGALPGAGVQHRHRARIDMRQSNANMACDNITEAYTMIAVCDTALRFHPPPDIDGWIRTPSASNGTQTHTMAPLPTLTVKKVV